MFTYLCAKFSKSIFIHPSIHYSIFISIVEKQPVRTVRILFEHLGWWMLECTSSCCRMLLRVGAESRGTACSFFAPLLLFFFFFFASGTQLPHLTFSIWPLPRGEIARVSKGGRHTSWILLSFNLHSPFSPWWCTWIGNEDIAQLRGFPRLLPRYCGYFCGTLRFWCIMDMDIGFTAFVWCPDTSADENRNSSAPPTGSRLCHVGGTQVCQSSVAGFK